MSATSPGRLVDNTIAPLQVLGKGVMRSREGGEV
jgi:hypothetical protein